MKINFGEIFNSNTFSERLNTLNKLFRFCFGGTGTIANKYTIKRIGRSSGFFSQFLCRGVFNSIHN